MNGELTERERRILAMWPRYEDGEPVWIGDEATNNKNQRFTVKRIEFRHGKWMLNDSVTEGHYLNGKSGERADGVPVRVTATEIGRTRDACNLMIRNLRKQGDARFASTAEGSGR